MKKVLLTAMTILSVASASVFGMYGNGDSWIDFLVHGNQFRARMDQLGFTLGNGTIKGTFGFKINTSNLALGQILSSTTGAKVSEGVKEEDSDNFTTLGATISAGIGYTSDAFGIGLGYNYTFLNRHLGMHTPVLAINALNDNLRIVVPFQIAMSSSDKITYKYGEKEEGGNLTDLTGNTKDYQGFRTEAQIRYYTGIDAFNAIRFYLKYGQESYKGNTQDNTSEYKSYVSSSLGLELRLYFLNTTVGNASVNPYLKVKYNTALEGDSTDVKLGNYYLNKEKLQKDFKYDYKAYDFTIQPTLALSANSDVVSLLFEPSLGYTVSGNGIKDSGLTHKLAWGAYTELYFTPVKDLEWYFEMDVNNNSSTALANKDNSPVYFETSTGITWYLPSFGGDAQ